MAEIITSKGMMDESLLWKTTMSKSDDDAFYFAEEWHDGTGEIVKRNIHVELKRGLDIGAVQGSF